MAVLSDRPIRTYEDIQRFEAEMTLEQRLPERSVLDVFVGAAARRPERIAITMVMTGDADEQPRRVSYRDLLGLVRRAANAFHALGGPRPGVAYMLPYLVETHATLWGGQAAGYRGPDQLPAATGPHRRTAAGLRREDPRRPGPASRTGHLAEGPGTAGTGARADA